MNKNKIICAGFAVYFGGMFLVNTISPNKDFSETENRVLAQKPDVTIEDIVSGSFQKDYEEYISDQFIFRDAWVAAKALSEKMSGKSENNGVYIADGDTLIERVDKPDIERVEMNTQAVEKFAQKVDVPVYLALVPTSAEIWRYKLPNNAPTIDEKQLIDSIKNDLEYSIAMDCYENLKNHNKEDIYYRTDHHWTTLGAYYAYEAMAQQMGITPIEKNTLLNQTVSDSFFGTYYSSSGVRFIKPDTIQKMVENKSKVEILDSGKPVEAKMYEESFLEKKDKYRYFLGGNHAAVKITTPDSPDRKLLILRDSYADSQVQYWTNHFNEIHMLDLRYMKGSIAEYVSDNNIDDVLVMYSAKNFVNDTNLTFISK